MSRIAKLICRIKITLKLMVELKCITVYGSFGKMIVVVLIVLHSPVRKLQDEDSHRFGHYNFPCFGSVNFYEPNSTESCHVTWLPEK